ncbi:MAG TPA: hypothetical protein VIY48_13145 [Candidatus Paceibacterota bacterium]
MGNDFEISHNWGNPREPEDNDVGRVAFATCRKGNVSLWFNIIPKKAHSEQIVWVVAAPTGIRNFANGSFEKSIDICNKVIQYLSQEHVRKEFQSNKQEPVEFVLDTKNIPRGIRWLPHKMAGIRERNVRLFMLLPEIYAASLLGIGYAIAFLSLIIEIDPGHQHILRTATYTVACLALIRLFTEIRNDYELSELGMSMEKFKNKNLDVRRSAISITIHAWGVRYVATASLAGLLIYICSNNV